MERVALCEVLNGWIQREHERHVENTPLEPARTIVDQFKTDLVTYVMMGDGKCYKILTEGVHPVYLPREALSRGWPDVEYVVRTNWP